MRSALVLFLLVPAGPAMAHPGHLAAGLAGHDHWVAGAAIGAALAAGVLAALKGRRRPQAEPDPGTSEDSAEAPA
jgi:hypothetical protein